MKKKKGFTLVELLVVIAILAVLATVSVVGYMGFTKKAHESNDIGLTTQMNTILQAEEVTNKPTSPHDAVQQLANGGVDVEKLTPTTDGYNYVYDLDTNRMFLLDGNKAVVAPTNITFTEDLNIFAFVGSENEITNWNGYSVYLKSGFTFNNGKTLTLSTGVDVGDNEVDTINYERKNVTNKQTVLIRTTDGLLNIDAEKDTINHYGSVDEVNVINCDMNSYHVFGIIKNSLLLNNGHVFIEKLGDVNSINVTSTSSSSFKITNNNGGNIGFITANDPTILITSGNEKNVDVDNDEIVQSTETAEALIYNTKTGYSNIWDPKLIEGKTTLLKDVTYLDGQLSYNKNSNYTIDLNGKNLNVNIMFMYKNEMLNIVDSSKNHSGKLNANVIQIGYDDSSNSKTAFLGNVSFNNVNVIANDYFLIMYGNVSFNSSNFEGYITVNGQSKYSNRQNPQISITANNSKFVGPLYLAGFGNYTFINNTFEQDGFPLYFKAGNIFVSNNTFNLKCENKGEADYIFYGNGAYDQNTAIMIDEAPGYKGFGEVEIGSGNKFNFNGTFSNDYYEVMYNIIPDSTETAHVVIANDITKTCTARDFVAKKIVKFSYINEKGETVTNSATLYFVTMEKAIAYTESIYTKNNPTHTIISLSDVIEIK